MTNASILAGFIADHPRLTILSGAGCSSASGIPEYRDDDGEWVHARPVQFANFVGSADVRKRYWARSFVGWRRMSKAEPNTAHRALARLENSGYVRALITQNVDNLHRSAGSRNVIDLHGVLRVVRCLGCDRRLSRYDVQIELERLNPDWAATITGIAPDGDAHIAGADSRDFRIPPCSGCGGILKPDVVFFGENVPRERVAEARRALAESDALVVVGSSLMVFSGFRFAREANASGKPVVIVNRGRTRADDLASVKITADCGETLAAAVDQLGA